MSCDFTERVSLLVDGELAPAEVEQTRKHLTECLVCHQMEQDFLGLRDQIRSYEIETEPLAQRQTLRNVLASQKVPLWQRRIALPAPVFALVVVAVLALGTWVLFIRGLRSAAPDVRVTNAPAQTGQPEPGGVDFSHYDRGERAVIYKVRRSQ